MEIFDPAAIDTLIFLKGIQPGDEIQYVRLSEHEGPKSAKTGDWLAVSKFAAADEIREGELAGWRGAEESPIVCLAGAHLMSRKNISGWRRGKS